VEDRQGLLLVDWNGMWQNWETSFGGKMSTSNLVREDVVRVETTSGCYLLLI